MTTQAAPAIVVNLPRRLAAGGYALLLTACVVFSVGWLGLGAVVAAASYSKPTMDQLAGMAARGNAWAQGVIAATPRSEPLGQAVLDYGFSALNLVIAGLLLFLGLRTWVTQLLAIAMIGSAGAFNLQAHAATVAVKTATGLDIGGTHQVLLHGVACAAYVVALLLLPAGTWRLGPSSGVGRWALIGAGVGTLVVVGIGTTLLPHTISCILFFGFGVPLVGLTALRNRVRGAATTELRTQARLLFSVMLGALGTIVALGLLTVILAYLDEPGLVLQDPTAHTSAIDAGAIASQPTALLFWFSRLSAAGIGMAVLVAVRRGGLFTAERLFSRGLASVMVVVLVGGGYVVVHAIAAWLPNDRSTATATALATGIAAICFLPLYLRAERLVERLLYGQRPTPYRVLAEVAALSRTSSTEGPNLAGVAEAIGRGLGARSCRLTVLRPGLRDRTYAWSDGSDDDEDHLVLPIRQGRERIGSIAVDRGAVAGLHNERRQLLEDVAGSLGAILQASRLGIELEPQLRAALAHAEEIAVSRREAVAEMDSERRMIERDLHDGAQHHLVSLRLALGLVEHEVGSGKIEQARGRLDQLANQVTMTETVLAKTASGVSSIVLAESGIAAALTADLSGAEPPIAVHFADDVENRRFGQEIEEAVYYCCLESVNNARKYAGGAPIAVRLDTADGTLRFTVRDEGPGFDPSALSGSPGRGMRNTAARIHAVNGQIVIDSAPGAGTTVRGAVPLPAGVGAPVPHAGRQSSTKSPVAEGRTAEGRTAEGAAPPLTPPAGAQALTRAPTGQPRLTAGQQSPTAAPGQPGRQSTRPPGRPSPTPRSKPTPTPGRQPPPTVEPAAASVSEATNGEQSLLGQARAMVRTARGIYVRPDDRARIDELTSQLDTPLRIAVVGPAGAGTSTLVRALSGLPGPPLELVSGADLDDQTACPADAVLLLLREVTDDDPRRPAAPTIGVLARADEVGGSGLDALQVAQRRAEEFYADPALHERCQAIIPVAALLAEGGAGLTDDDVQALRELTGQPAESVIERAAPALLERLGGYGVRLAVELIREGAAPNRALLADELVRLSGLPRLRELLAWRFARSATAVKVRAVLHGLEQLAHTSATRGSAADELLFHLERLRFGAHELVEIDLSDALLSGSLRLPDTDRATAERLLGMSGTAPSTRLGLSADAGPEEMRQAAENQLAYWRRLASHPATTSAVRDAAGVLGRTCEELLARTDADVLAQPRG